MQMLRICPHLAAKEVVDVVLVITALSSHTKKEKKGIKDKIEELAWTCAIEMTLDVNPPPNRALRT